MTKELQEYLQSVQVCLTQCEDMLEKEQEKRRALLGRDMTTLEKVMGDQQANMMQLERIERQRLQAQKKAGYGELSAREVLEKIPEGEDRVQAEALFSKLRGTAMQLQALNQEAMDIAQNELQFYEQYGAIERRNTQSPTYRPGQNKRTDWSSFEQKI